MAVLGYLPKLKTDLGLAFGAYFLHDFSVRFQLTKFQFYTFFSSQVTNQNVLLSSYVGN